MRVSMFVLGGLAMAAATPAFAQDASAAAPTTPGSENTAAAPTAPPAAITINGTATLVSDYRFRGISQTDKNFAVQGGVTVSHESGFYVSFWGSSVHSYVTSHADAAQELDLIAGFKKTVKGTTFDIGALYYVYPHTTMAGDRSSSDFIEPYADISHVWGPFTGKVTVNYAPKQKALALDQGQSGTLKKNDNTYLAGDFALGVPKTPLSFTAHIGHTWGPSWLSIGKDYTDWGAGAALAYKQLTFGINYVDTDGDFITPTGKNASKGGVVGSVGVSF
jgi:uncharacterized protein (TIGR02001 family)